jgi:hypothetical protein
MLRHACGYALANAGQDTRRIQDWLGASLDRAHDVLHAIDRGAVQGLLEIANNKHPRASTKFKLRADLELATAFSLFVWSICGVLPVAVRVALHHRVRLRIINRPAGFSAIAAANTARPRASVRQIASVS